MKNLITKIYKVSIVVTRYNESNETLFMCLKGLAKQKKCICFIYVLDQKDDKETEILCNKLTSKNIKFFYKKIPVKGLSYARNLGIKYSKTDIILFIDSDAIPDEYWAYNLTKVFYIYDAIGIVGGKSEPLWRDKLRWYCYSNLLEDMYSILNLNENIIQTNKIMGVNFGINRKILGKETYFNENFGRRPGLLIGGEETDLCRRCLKKGFKILYTPFAIVKHQIFKERMQLKWIIKRFYFAGHSRNILGGMPQPYIKKFNIYDVLLLIVVIIPYILGYIKGKLNK